MRFEQTQLSRRSFLATSAAAMAGLALFPGAGRAAEVSGFGGLPMSVQSYTLRDRPFGKALKIIKTELKLDFVEIWPGHPGLPKTARVKQMLDENGLKASGWGVVAFTKDTDANRKIFEIAKELSVPHITCDPDPDSFDSLDKLTEEYAITADIHDHGPGNRWGKIDAIWNGIKDHSKMIGLCNDTGHFIHAGEDPFRACEVFKDRMHAMHLKDFKQTANGGWQDCPLGDGKLPFQKIMKWVLDKHFKGDFALEYEGGNPVKVCQGDLQRIQKAVSDARPE